MVKVDHGFELFCKEDSEAQHAKLDKKKSLWEDLDDEEKEKYEKRAAREILDSLWSAARKKVKLSGWILFVQEKSKDISGDFLSRSSQISSAWKAMSDAEKEKYNQKAAKANEENNLNLKTVKNTEKKEPAKKADKKEPAKKADKKEDDKKEGDKKPAKKSTETGKRKETEKKESSEKKETSEKKDKKKDSEKESDKPKKKPVLKKKKVAEAESD